jgi:peptidoglycan-associated lipoprotein
MQLRRTSRTVIAVFAVAALGMGCALFGGAEDERLGTRDDFGADGRGIDGTGMNGVGERVAELETVYFDFDRSVIRDDQKPTLRANAAAINANPAWRTVVIEGHCDERGSEEYNLALGERRANAAKQYLVDSGVSAARVDTVSFGKSRPAVQGHDESAWRWNRRAEFRVIR